MRLFSTLLLAAALPAALALPSGRAAAQGTCDLASTDATDCTITATNAVSLNLNKIMRVGTVNATYSLTAPAPTDFSFTTGAAQVTEAAGAGTPRIQIVTNVPWRLSVASNSWTAPTGVTKPVEDLAVQVEGNATFIALSTGGSDVFGTGGGTPTFPQTQGVHDLDLLYRTTWNLANDAPGSYAITVTYTVAAD